MSTFRAGDKPVENALSLYRLYMYLASDKYFGYFPNEAKSYLVVKITLPLQPPLIFQYWDQYHH